MKTTKTIATVGLLIAIAMVVAGCAGGPDATPAGGGDVGTLDAASSDISSFTEKQKANVEAAFSASFEAARDRELDPGKPDEPIRVLSDGVLIQRFSGGDDPLAFVMAGPDAWYAHLVRGPILGEYLNGGVEKYGVPVSDEYPYGRTGYAQRFEAGVLMTEDGAVTFEEDPWEEPEVPDSIGRIRMGDEVLSELSEARLAEITRAYREAYVVALARGVEPGRNSDTYPDVHQWDGPIVQNLQNGSSTSGGWGIPNVALLFMQDVEEGRYAYLVHSQFADKMTIGEGEGAHSGGFGYGGAITNQYRCSGDAVCQAFGKGIMQLNPSTGIVEFIFY